MELREALEQAIERERQRVEQERRLREQAQAELERLRRILQERGINPEE
ncbi:MAG: hypothetical protein NZ874_03220 [Fimbriimonadales bacterium]|nr:hypothetical protein [Fimbriimonadales bacterium]